MASTRVRGGQGTAVSTSPSVTLAGNPTAGNLLVAWVTDNTSNAFTAANGFTALTPVSSGTMRGVMLWKVATSSDAASATVTPASVTSTGWVCSVSEWTNAAFSDWLAETENSQAVASTVSYTTPSRTPTASLADCVVATGYYAPSKTWSAEAVSGTNVGTVTEDADTTGLGLATAAISSTTGAYQGSATASNPAVAGIDAIAIFKTVAAATKAPPPFPRPLRIWTRRR